MRNVGRRRLVGWLAAGVCMTGLLASGGCEFEVTTSTTSAAAESGESPPPPVRNNFGPIHYRKLLIGTFELLNTYWGNQLPDLGAEDPGPPLRLISYWNRSQDPGCGGRRNGPGNAVYCSYDETISWDGNWMLGELYRGTGDAAVMFVLAHEYGHLAQDRLGIFDRFKHSIEAELNADCFAGAWLDSVDRKVSRFDNSDFRAFDAVLRRVSDPRWVPWRNPDAHGNIDERSHAVFVGARRGQRECLRRYGPGFTE